MENAVDYPNLDTNDFWLFPELKIVLKGRRFQDTDSIKINVTTTLKAIPEQEFQKCFQTVAASLG
jgi:hypothetical protein